MNQDAREGRWLAVVGSPDGERATLAREAEPWAAPELFDGVDEVLSSLDGAGEAAEAGHESGEPERAVPQGLVILAPDVPETEALRAMEGAAAGEFVVAQAVIPESPPSSEEAEEGSGSRLRLRSLSVGFEESLGRFLERWAPQDGSTASVLELRHALGLVRRVRHDINNPLTAALAEVQLLLMDVTDEESRESLEVVQEQLRRIRERVQELSGLRPPSA